MFKETESNDRIALVGPGDNVSLLQLVHPGAGVGLDSNSKLLETARNTLAWFNSNPKRPSWLQKDNNLPQIFTDAATLGWDADDLYQWFHRYLREEERPNLTYQGWGIEGAGATEAIHRMMLQSHEDVLRFFPVWPRDKDAQFTRLRARGAFLVTARLKNGVVEGVTITSTKGTDLRHRQSLARQKSAGPTCWQAERVPQRRAVHPQDCHRRNHRAHTQPALTILPGAAPMPAATAEVGISGRDSSG